MLREDAERAACSRAAAFRSTCTSSRTGRCTFEVEPKQERWDDYLGTATLLRPELEKIDGFVDNHRYRSQRSPARILSLSTWRDEKAVVRWRAQSKHHLIGQTRGRFEIFQDYRLRVGEVTSDQPEAPVLPQQRFDETAVGSAKALSLTEYDRREVAVTRPSLKGPLANWELYEHLLEPAKVLLLASWLTAAAAAGWREPEQRAGVRHRQVRVIRDYGLRQRQEAPQYFPPVGDQ